MSEENKHLSDELRDLLRLDGYPVAVKLIDKLEEFERLHLQHPKQPSALCRVVVWARYARRRYLCTANDLTQCWGGLATLGLAEMPEDVREGKRYAGWELINEDASRKFVEALPKFEVGTYKAVLISSLEICPINPDVVLFFGNSAQITVLNAAYLYDKGGDLTFKMSTAVGCAYAITEPIKTGKPNLVIPCNGMRLLALPNENDIIFAIPFMFLKDLLNGVKFLHQRGGPRYPPGWQHIYWQPEPPITYITDPKGPGPIWLMRQK